MINKIIKKILVTVMLMAIASSGSFAETKSENQDLALLKLIKTAMSSAVMIQNVTKAYLYASNDVATTKAEREQGAALKAFDAKFKKLNVSINDPKMKNLLLFIESNREEIGDLLKEPYSLDNAQEIIDLAESISEGEFSIANKIKAQLKGKVPAFKGQRYLVAQVGKYYMAYKAGIKDKNTIKNMHKSVKLLAALIDELKTYPQNTPEMNRIMNRVEKDWKIVHQFYLDIKEGDLPLIVYDTTHKLDRKFLKYAEALLKSKSN
jgi:hypothetical protein